MKAPFEKFEVKQTLSLGHYILITEPEIGWSLSHENIKTDIERLRFVSAAIHEKLEREGKS